MNFLIPNAMAQAAPGAPADPGLASFLPLAILFLVFYLFLIRPQMKRQKEHSKMVQGLSKGDEAVTNGGLLGGEWDADAGQGSPIGLERQLRETRVCIGEEGQKR